MIKDLFLNVTTIIAVVSIGNQILINREISPSSPLRFRVFFGLMAGLLGVLLMLNSVKVIPDVIVDFRNIAAILSALYCGFASAMITGLIIAVFRLFFYGLTYSSVISAITAVVIGIGCAFISKYKVGTLKKWIAMSLIVLTAPSISMAILIDNQALLTKTIVVYWIGIALVSALLYLYVRYLDLSRFLYRKYQIDSSKDHRTGLNNVRQFDHELNKIIRNLSKSSLITLLFMDIDFFKKINDNYGHQNGDKILEDLGKILLNSCNYSDIVSRNGGDEFSVLMTDCPRDKVLVVAERIRARVQDHSFYLIDGQVINITVSIGVAIYPDTVDDINLIVEKADLALYEAKRAGRNRVYLSGSKLQTTSICLDTLG